MHDVDDEQAGDLEWLSQQLPTDLTAFSQNATQAPLR